MATTGEIFGVDDTPVAIKFVGTNNIGRQVTIIVHSVRFPPAEEFNVITDGDDVAQFVITGEAEITDVNGSSRFGTWTLEDGEASPDVQNYYRGTGNVSFGEAGETDLEAQTWRHVGNVPSFVMRPSSDRQEHRSSMVAGNPVDFTFGATKNLEVEITLEELSDENAAIILGTDLDETL